MASATGGSLSKWLGGPNFIKMKKYGNGSMNSGPSGKRHTRYRPGAAAARAFYDSPAGKIAGAWEREHRRPWFTP